MTTKPEDSPAVPVVAWHWEHVLPSGKIHWSGVALTRVEPTDNALWDPVDSPNRMSTRVDTLVRQSDHLAAIAALQERIKHLEERNEWLKGVERDYSETIRGLQKENIQLRQENAEIESLLLKAEDAIEVLDGVSVENENLVDAFRAWKATRATKS